MKEVIAMHGWSGDSNTWKMWAELFQNNGWIWQSVERGYGDIPPFHPIWKDLSTKNCFQRRVVVAHSLGSHLIKKDVLEKATDVVLLCSFSRFIPLGNDSRFVKAALRGMQQQLGTVKEATMLNNFLKKACHPSPISSVPPGPITKGLSCEGRKKLQADLELLIKTHKIPNGLPAQSRVLIVQGEKDSIIVPSTSSALKKDLNKYLNDAPTHWNIPEAGHLLLVPGLINRIRDWLNSYP